MTVSTKSEDRENLKRSEVTVEEFAEHLKFADALAVMRLREHEVGQFGAVGLVAGALWAFGIGFRLVELEFGIFYAVCVGLTFTGIYRWKLRSVCPRCGERFSHQATITPRFNALRFRMSSTAESCSNCGLRALSTFDIQRFLQKQHGDSDDDPSES